MDRLRTSAWIFADNPQSPNPLAARRQLAQPVRTIVGVVSAGRLISIAAVQLISGIVQPAEFSLVIDMPGLGACIISTCCAAVQHSGWICLASFQ